MLKVHCVVCIPKPDQNWLQIVILRTYWFEIYQHTYLNNHEKSILVSFYHSIYNITLKSYKETSTPPYPILRSPDERSHQPFSLSEFLKEILWIK